MSDIEFRVDEAFSTAVQQQLEEQRKIRQLVARVEETLISLSDGMGDLSAQLDLTAREVKGATPADIEQMRTEIIDHVSRIAAQVDAVAQASARDGSVDRLDGQISGLAREVISTRDDLLDAVSQLQQDAAPVAETVDRIRADVVDALERIPAALASHQDTVWTDAVSRLDQAIERITAGQVGDRQAMSDLLLTWQADAQEAVTAMSDRRSERDTSLLQAIDGLQDEVKGVTVRGDEADRLLADRVMTATADLATEVASRHEDLLSRLTHLGSVAGAVAPDVSAALDQIASRLADMVSRTHDDAMQAVEAAGAARGATPEEVRGIVAGLVEHMDSRVNSALADVVDRNATATDAVTRAADVLERRSHASTTHLDQISDRLLAALVTATEHHTEIVDAGVENAVATLVSHQTESSRHVREATELLLAAATDLQPHLTTALGELKDTLLQQAGADRDEVESAFSALADASTEARDGILNAVGRATTRLAEVQAEGIGRLTSVADELGRVPETVTPAVQAAVADMQAGVADAISDLRAQSQDASLQATQVMAQAIEAARALLAEQTSAAGTEAASSWKRLTEVQQTHASTLQHATSALTTLADDLEPRVRSAMTDTSTVLREHIDSASTLISDAARDAGEQLRQDAVDMGGGLRAAGEEAAAALAQAVNRAAEQLDTTQQEGLTALGHASGRVHEASVEVATVMGSTRAGLLEAIAGAKAEIEALLARTDQATSDAITEAVATASERWLAEVSAQGVALSARTQEIIRATADISPAVDELVSRLKGEVAAIASQVLADVHAPMAETNRIVDALEPSITVLIADLRESVRAEIVQATSAAAAETDRIVRAVDVVEQQTTEQVGRLIDAAATLESTGSQIRPEIEAHLDALRSAVSDTGQVVDNRLSTIADVTEAQLDAVRRSATAHEAIVTETTQSFASEFDAGVAKTRDALTQGLEVLVAGLTTTMEAHIGSLQTVLADTVDQTSGAATSIDGTAATVTAAVQEALDALKADLATQTDGVQDQLMTAIDGLMQRVADANQQTVTDIGAATQRAVSESIASNDQLRDHVIAQVASVTERLDDAVQAAGDAALAAGHAGTKADQAAAQADRTSQDLVGIGGQVVGSVEAAIVALSGQLQDTHSGLQDGLSDHVAVMVSEVRGTVDSAVSAAVVTLEQRAAELQARISQMEGVESDVVARLDALVAEVSGRLTGELVMTRDTIRDATRTESEAADQAMAMILARLDAMPADMRGTVHEVVHDAVHDAVRGTITDTVTDAVAAAVAEERGLSRSLVEDVVLRAIDTIPEPDAGAQRRMIEEAVRVAITAIPAPDRSDEHTQVDAVVQRLEQLAGQLSESDDRRGIDLKRLQSALTDLHGEMRADGDALLDAVASRVDQVIGRLSTVVNTPGPVAEANDELAQTASLVSDAVAQLQALGSQMERQVKRVEQLDVRIDQTLRHGLAEMQSRLGREPSRGVVPAPARPSTPTVAAPAARATHATLPPPKPKADEEVVVTTSSSTTCPECGFVARTRQGLVAHQKTCATRR